MCLGVLEMNDFADTVVPDLIFNNFRRLLECNSEAPSFDEEHLHLSLVEWEFVDSVVIFFDDQL